jgi:hypothetical protein
MRRLTTVENSRDDFSVALYFASLEERDEHLVILAHEVQEIDEGLAILLAFLLRETQFIALSVHRREEQYEILDIMRKQDRIVKEVISLHTQLMTDRAQHHQIAQKGVDQRLIQRIQHLFEIALGRLHKDHSDQIVQVYQLLSESYDYIN